MMAAALELGLVTPSMRIDCSASRGRFGSNSIRDTKPQERSLSPEEILIFSSNIGMANIFTRLVPPDQGRNTALMAPVRDKLLAFGFDQPTGVPLPFEAAGRVSPLKNWSRNYSLVSVSFGMELAVTPLQMAAAVAILGDGRYRAPRLVAAVRERGGAWQPTPRATPRPVFRRVHADLVRDWMVEVLAVGLRGDALIEGVLVAAKTGTADDEAHKPFENHSFVALAPADAPQLALVVMVQHPQHGRYASQTTRPAALRALGRALKYLGISPGPS
jgi:cell division protein FtsI (penicillin-binding protein 3)